MAFYVNCDFDPIQSYAQAVKAWEKAVIFPKDRKHDSTWLERGLVSVRKKHMTIQRTTQPVEGGIVLRLYGHPTVTWRRDNSFTLCAYNSRSTAVFASHCMPAGIFVSSGRHFTVTVDGRAYKVKDEITFRQCDNTWKADTITPWSIRHVNRERARQALQDTNYNEFRLWLQVYLQMASPPPQDWIHKRITWSTPKVPIVSLVRDRSKWRELAAYFQNKSADQVLHIVRHAIYQEYDCIDNKSVPFLG